MSREDRALKAEIDSLRSQLEVLRLRGENLEERVRDLEAEREERLSGYEGSRVEEAAPSSIGGQSSWSSITARSSGPVDPADRGAREALCAQIGGFIRRAVRGEHRGTSGRDRLRLANRCYLVFANFEGEIFSEPLFCNRFSEVAAVCKRQSDCGRAIFVGLPTLWEARSVCRSAGYDLPAGLRNGD